MKLVVVRHGETEWNAMGRSMGQLDSPLTPTGVRQATLLARRLTGIAIDAIYSSDLGRAVRTAEILATEIGVPVRLDSRLRERHLGIFQGLTLAEMRDRFPTDRADYERGDDEYVIPGGESARQKVERSMQGLTEIASGHPNQTVVVVTHDGVLTALFEYALRVPSDCRARFARDNASYNEFEHSDGMWRLETWNDTSHLV